jgi:cytidylate kinase
MEAGPVVTVSRQAGVKGTTLARRVAETLNQRLPQERSWVAYDRELVELVAKDHALSRDLVARLDEHDKTWFEHFIGGLAGAPTGADLAMKMARTIRALAWVGRAVIVGRGAAAILGDVKRAVRVRLTAPLEWRVDELTGTRDISRRQAAAEVREMDDDRAQFVRRHFNRELDDPLLYDIVLNMARVDIDRAADVIARMVQTLDGDESP